MASLLASPSAATPAASSPSRLCTSTRRLQFWIASSSGSRARCSDHAGQAALDVSSSSCRRGLPSLSVSSRLNSATHYSLVVAGNKLTLPIQRRMTAKSRRSFTVGCEYGGGSKGGSGGDFFAGFLLGGAICGTLAYIFAPQIRRSLLNEDESGFQRANKPVYYDEGLEKTRQTLNEKISQLNSAIDNVSSRLRGRGNDVPAEEESIEADSEVEGLEASV